MISTSDIERWCTVIVFTAFAVMASAMAPPVMVMMVLEDILHAANLRETL